MIKLKHILLEKIYTKEKSNVLEIQAILDILDFDLGPTGIDGIYGRKTKQAVRDFQKQYGGIGEDGIVGPETWEAFQKTKKDLEISDEDIQNNIKASGYIRMNSKQNVPSADPGSVNVTADELPDDSDITDMDISKPVTISGSYPKQNVRMVEKAMDEYGITNPYTRIAILSVIAKESGFVPKSETPYRNTSNSRIRKIFGKRVRDLSDDELTKLKADDKAFFDKVYGGRYHNAEDEGYKYRGRGFNQVTFKSAYEKYGRYIGKDLVSNPDMLNEPKIAAMVAVMFLKRRLNQKFGSSLGDFTNQKEANIAVANANSGWGKERGHSGLERAIKNTELASAKFNYPEVDPMDPNMNLASL